MASEIAPQAIYDMFPEQIVKKLKFLVILRETSARDLSWYNHKFGEKFVAHGKPRFVYNVNYPDHVDNNLKLAEEGRLVQDDSTNILRKGIYSYHLKRWFEFFDKSQFFIVNYDTLFKDATKDTMIRIANFLEIW